VPSSLQRLSMLAGLLTELNIKPFRLTGSPALAGLSFWCAEAKSPRLNQRKVSEQWLPIAWNCLVELQLS
jgi:hypothetical protein